tara:strand:- start:226 stop:471 length:246 start_codon:yes stop_codon:yes gene_type:complete
LTRKINFADKLYELLELADERGISDAEIVNTLIQAALDESFERAESDDVAVFAISSKFTMKLAENFGEDLPMIFKSSRSVQ